MEGYDYKEILKNKINVLSALFHTYKDSLTDEERNSIEIMLDNATLSVDGRLDSLDYDVRDRAIMDWHARLDEKINLLKSRFDEKDIENQK